MGKNERRFERAKSMAVEAFEAECQAKLDAREAAKSGGPSQKKTKNADYWEKKRKKSKQKDGKEKAQDLTAAQIEQRREHFQAKKKRRTEPKDADTVPTTGKATGKIVAPSGAGEDAAAKGSKPNRKARREALQKAGKA